MAKVISADGTVIAFERLGDGPPVIVVGGALCDQMSTRPTAEALAWHFTVLNYDRRGRGASGDTEPYAVEREIDDLAALIDEAGGRAAVYGHSSGAALALRAAAHGLPVTRLVLHEPPYNPDDDALRREARRWAATVTALLSAGRRADAVESFMRLTGVSGDEVRQMRHEPWWPAMESRAHTLRYDSEVMADATGGTLPPDLPGTVPAPTLVLTGGESPSWMLTTNQRLAEALPHGRLHVLPGEEHVVPPEILTPVLVEFLGDR
ncbi:alpha/beta hydrolase [Sphaerisporangium rubeum]|uniref:Pimeloyl-ACP methyl ester carboxylesterase n=1 Tax=Sphaerisporangium rubeum TaxID=321317 RepID=A0A7X0IHY5_9ACTN|nr:alpha/beta hydrolase [Sphaerisporangium rubeum]MBB6473982.1 pimeloyl-ACP methyl ester carboxylesterase [Sphaerisporangium rubeum]